MIKCRREKLEKEKVLEKNHLKESHLERKEDADIKNLMNNS